MLKNNLLTILILCLFLFSLKSLAVGHPEYINWRAHPREFVISLSEAIFGTISEDNTFIDNAASRINTDPNSRLELFWLFLDAPKYRYSEWAKQDKEYQVYYKYVTSDNIEKYSYYVSKQQTGADMSIQGMYTFGVAMALRDFYATFVPRSTEYGEMRNFVPRYLRSSSISNPISTNSVPSGKCPLFKKDGGSLKLDANNDQNNQTQIICKYYPIGLLEYEISELKISGTKHGLYLNYSTVSTENTHYLLEYGYYIKGKRDGVFKHYFEPNELGEVQLAVIYKYNNGVKLLDEFFYLEPSQQLRARIKYINGKLGGEQTSFYRNGQMKERSTYYPDGSGASHEEWYEDGRKK